MQNRKDTLVSLQAELQDRVAKIDKDLHSRMTSSKFSEQVVDRQNDDVLLNLRDEAKRELEQIEHALLKFDNNRYGTCEKCHRAISDERLDAIPFASHCKSCAA